MAGAHGIGILTSGGDAPGMNPAIRAIVRTAGAEGITCIGIRRGYAGLINGDVFELTGNDVDGPPRRYHSLYRPQRGIPHGSRC